MGWGAAYALAKEWADWCDGPEEAYAILYGDRENAKPRGDRLPCPICNKKCKGPDGVIMHMDAKHTKTVHDETKAAFRAMYGRDAE